jgi:hypothetical protein
MKSSAGRSWKMKRKARLPGYSNSFVPMDVLVQMERLARQFLAVTGAGYVTILGSSHPETRKDKG